MILVTFIAFFLIELAAFPSELITGQQSTGALVAETIVMLLLIVPEYCVNVKRLHDLGKDDMLAKVLAGISLFSVAYGLTLSPSSDFSAVIIPIALGIISLAGFFYLLFTKGESYSNSYGVAQ